MNFIGIEIGGTKLQVVAGRGREIVDRRRFSVVRVKGGEGIRAQIASALEELLPKHQPAALGIGFGGPIDWRTGLIARSHQVEGWTGFNLCEWLGAETKIPCAAENDANLAALAEAQLGAGRGVDPVFYVTLGSGVGGGLVVAGSIYHGARFGEAEIGQLCLDREGRTLESRCSGWAVDRRIQAAILQNPNSVLAKLIGAETGGEARHLAPALLSDDLVAREILSSVAGDLTLALSHVVHLMHPEVIVLGGGLSQIGEPLRAAVEEHLTPLLMETFSPGPRIALAALGEDAVPVGALLLAENALAAHPAREI